MLHISPAITCDGNKAHVMAGILNAPYMLLCLKLGHQPVVLLKGSGAFKGWVLVKVSHCVHALNFCLCSSPVSSSLCYMCHGIWPRTGSNGMGQLAMD